MKTGAHSLEETNIMTIYPYTQAETYTLTALSPVTRKFIISTELLGEAFEPEQKFENPDGSPIIFNKDYFGTHRSINPLPGPFEDGESASRQLL